jgi:excisionase family DNA binding protein
MSTQVDRKVTKGLHGARRAWSISEVCETLTLSRGFVNSQIRTGHLRAKKLGRRTLILDEDLTDYLANALPTVGQAGIIMDGNP